MIISKFNFQIKYKYTCLFFIQLISSPNNKSKTIHFILISEYWRSPFFDSMKGHSPPLTDLLKFHWTSVSDFIWLFFFLDLSILWAFNELTNFWKSHWADQRKWPSALHVMLSYLIRNSTSRLISSQRDQRPWKIIW